MQSLYTSAQRSRYFRDERKLRYYTQLCVVLLLCPTTLRSSMLAEGNATAAPYLLGFLSPSPGAIFPVNLATEWRSAFQVAVDVLNMNRSYQLKGYIQDSECTFLEGQAGAEEMLQQAGLVGAVGPACSQAAISAARIFNQNTLTALVSFAATAEPLWRRFFPSLFRTVYSDRHQAHAIAASMAKLDVKNATLLYTNDYYSENLAHNINETVADIRLIMLERGLYNYTVNRDQLKSLFNSLDPNELVILAMEPILAENFWTIAFELGKTSYPWWYFGTDGATAFDPDDVDAEVMEALRGEIGLAPYGGDSSSTSRCSQFYSYWQEKAEQYPGLPALGVNKSRSYVPYLFDAVTAFYEVLDGLEFAGLEFSRENVYMAFNESGSAKISFQGCTGLVEFDPDTGSRSTTAQPPVYDLVTLMASTWERKGRIENGTFVSLEPLERPGSYPAPGQEYYGPDPRKKTSAGLIAGIVFLVIAILVLVTACFVYYARKRKNQVFVRMS